MSGPFGVGGFGGVNPAGPLPDERCEICHHEAHGERCDFPGCACPDVAASSRFTWQQYASAVLAGVIIAVLAYGLINWF